MKNTIIVSLVLLIVLTSMTYAAPYIYQVRGLVNDVVVSGIDKEGEETFNVNPGDILKLGVRITNADEKRAFRLTATIFGIKDGNDLTKAYPSETDWFPSIGNETSNEQTVRLNIPIDDVVKDTYRLKLIVSYYGPDYNDTVYTFPSIYYDVYTQGTGSTSTSIDLQNSFSNLTYVCKDMVSSVNSYMNYLNQSASYFSQLTTCKEEKGALDLQQRDCASTLSACNTEKATCISITLPDLQGQLSACNTEKDARIPIYQCNNITESARQEERTKNNQDNTTKMLWMAGIAIAIWFYNQKKNKKPTVEEETYYLKK